MPDANGKYFLTDFVMELKARGFDGFNDTDLKAYVNRGYFHVARRHTWIWEEASDTFTLNPGSAYVDLWPTASGELPYFRSLDKLYVTTAGQQRKLTPLSDDDYFQNWAYLDLTATTNRAEPSSYYVFENKLYILPPPNSTRDFIAHYHRRMAPMVADGDSPMTPQHLDEAIISAALIRAHTRANEPQLAQMERDELEEFFDDMAVDEEEVMAEQPTRVKPDDTWL